ncbi:MAG: hypothetical protein QOI41_3709 [Myxococcales bacterium]|nr:hypothetical protein [Myxococcales bacterium]
MPAARLRSLHALSPAIIVVLAGVASICVAGACGSSGDATPGPHANDPDSAAPTADAAAPDDEGGSDAAVAQDSAMVDASLLAPGFVYRDVNHVLGTGQSLSVGTLGTPVLSLTQPYANVTFVTGVLSGGTGLTSFIPLVEKTVETHSSSFANLITMMARDVILVGAPAGQTSHDLLISQHGIGGQPYSAIKKGGTTTCYADGMAQAKAGHDLAVAAGKSYVIRAVTNVHGESDHIALNSAYEANLLQWQADYEADAKALSGQTEPVPMLHSQISSWTRFNSSTTSQIPAAQLAAHVDSAGKVVLVGAKYHLPYVADGVHLTTEGYQHMGEDYAKVYRRVILEGKAWEPVRPKTVTRAGAVVTVTMHVPAPPLVLDTTLVTDPGKFGFEWADDGPTTPTITSVALSGPDTVVVTLSATPTAAHPRLRYAYTGTAGALAGPTTGPRGNLRDSDATPSRNNYKLYNWCVHFEVAAP